MEKEELPSLPRGSAFARHEEVDDQIALFSCETDQAPTRVAECTAAFVCPWLYQDQTVGQMNKQHRAPRPPIIPTELRLYEREVAFSQPDGGSVAVVPPESVVVQSLIENLVGLCCPLRKVMKFPPGLLVRI